MMAHRTYTSRRRVVTARPIRLQARGVVMAYRTRRDGASWGVRAALDGVTRQDLGASRRGATPLSLPRSALEGGGDGTPQMLVAVSDKMKSKGRQDFRCLAKDQSFHTFMVP